jgi:ankyrin repeat protein
LFNATALTFAIMAANADAVPMLLERGDKLSDKFIQLGTAEGIAPPQAINFDDNKMLSALLDAGLSVESPDDGGFTLLDMAVISNRIEAVRLLVTHGANVNAVDQNGMTPLLYAASIDFGDSRMIDLLLKSGANKQARTKEGLTALELARKYDHIQLFKSLE